MKLPISETAHLRPVEEDDAAELDALVEASRPHLADWLPWAAGQTREDTEGFIRASQEQRSRKQGFQAAIVEAGEIAGIVGYHGIDWANRSTGIGYWLAQSRQGRGTMTVAVRALVDQALLDWDLNRVEIRAATENRRSRRIPERLGFQEEGTLREAEWVGDRRHDLVVYSMLAADWPGRDLPRDVLDRL